ncbi:MAG: hypothetical protein IKI04_01340 [Bacilli bacterium]|nr:hypothetical protein [Bacilli bacterium]
MMRDIYAVTLDDDVPLSEDTAGNIKEIAYLLFDEFTRYDKDLLSFEADNLIYNYLLEYYSYDKGKYVFRMLSDKNANDYRIFDPVILNDTAFGITTFPNSVTEAEILSHINRICHTLNLDYHFSITKTTYKKGLKERKDAIDKIKKEIYNRKKNNQGKSRVRAIIPLKRYRG